MRFGPHQPVIAVETRLRLLAPETCAGLLVRARLRYDARDPYAVHLLVDAEPKPVSWTFARELLAVGLDRPAGIGDVRVWPSPWAALWGEQVAIALSSPDGYAVLAVSRQLLVRFLGRTEAAVPPGQETAHHDLDAAVARLLEQPRRGW